MGSLFGELKRRVDYVYYLSFDPTQYPNFMKRVSGQGFEDRPVQKLPYRCNR